MKIIDTTLGFLVAMSAAVTAGCGGEAEFAEQPVPDAGPAPAPTPTPTPPPQDAGPPPATTGPCDPVQMTAFTTMFQGRAPSEAPNMTAEGAMVCGVVQEGQSVETPMFMLDPGHCYTVLGQGMPNVTEVDMKLLIDTQGLPPMLQAFAGKPMLAVDTQAGVMSSIGAEKNCYKWPWPVSAVVKLEVTATQGAGPIAAQVYKRKAQ